VYDVSQLAAFPYATILVRAHATKRAPTRLCSRTSIDSRPWARGSKTTP